MLFFAIAIVVVIAVYSFALTNAPMCLLLAEMPSTRLPSNASTSVGSRTVSQSP